jgi:ABC-type transport system involved in multi-copper enzyme maturation permease subunit
MGINPIEYRPWKGERTAQSTRVYAILRSVFRYRLKQNSVKILLIIAFMLIYAFQFISVPFSPHARLEAEEMSVNFNGFALAVFAMLLAAVVTSDLISEDLSGNSFVLYFARAIRTRDYLIGKGGGAILVMSMLCAIPPLLLAIISIATQSGSDYLHSLNVLGRTAAAGALATVFYVPYGMMMSSLTKRKSYAAVGTFMSFFALTIIAEAFVEFDSAWRIVSPLESLAYAFDWMFGLPIPDYIDKSVLVGFLTSFIVIPALVLYVRIERKAVGK